VWTQDIGGALSACQWWQLLTPLARVAVSLLHDLRLEHPFRRHLLAAFKAGSRAVPAGRIRCGNRYAAFPLIRAALPRQTQRQSPLRNCARRFRGNAGHVCPGPSLRQPRDGAEPKRGHGLG